MYKYKPLLTKIEISHIVALLYCTITLPICRLQILKVWTLYCYSFPAIGNSLSVTQKVHDFRYGKETLNNIVKTKSILKYRCMLL